MIETQMLVEAMELGTEDWEGAVVAAHYQLSKTPVPALSADRRIIATYDERHDAFHRALTSACRSEWLNRLAGQIGAQLQRYHRTRCSRPGRPPARTLLCGGKSKRRSMP